MRRAVLTSSAAALVLLALDACSSDKRSGSEDTPCVTSEECTGLGAGFSCVEGRCREGAADASVEASSGGSNTGGRANPGGAGGAPQGENCLVPRATYPEPPISGGTPGGNVEIVAVQYTADFGDAETVVPAMPPQEYLSIGFDLDSQCTTEANVLSGTCALPPYSQRFLDGPGGRDNAFGGIFQLVRNLMPGLFTSVAYTAELQRGVANLIFRVTGYNGEASDGQVRLDALNAAPYDALGDAGALPQWDGTDVWPVSSSSVTDFDRTKPLSFDPNAYVTANKVVASLPRFDVPIEIGLSVLGSVSWGLQLSGAVVVCDLARTGVGRWGFTLENCIVGGTILADDLVHQISAFPDPLSTAGGQKLCTASSLYRQFRDNLCELADLPSNPAAAPTASCDALSFGVAFDMRPGNLGDVVSVEPGLPGCPDATDPGNDSCANHGAEPGMGGGGGADAQ